MIIDREGLDWREDEKAYLIACAGNIRAKDIARHLRRSVEGIHQMASKLEVSLVTRICVYGHEMTMRSNGRYVCPKCHAIQERKRRRRNK